MAKVNRTKQKKKLIEIEGTKFSKCCLLLQFISIVVMILAMNYNNAHNIENGITTIIADYSIYVILVLMLLAVFSNKKNK